MWERLGATTDLEGSGQGKSVLRPRSNIFLLWLLWRVPLIGNIDSNLAELMAVKEAFQLFISSQWALSHTLAVESDSSNVVMWVNNPDKTPCRMRNLMAIIENMKLQVIGWSISHILREANKVADKLAKSGVKRRNDLVVYLD
ncbi:hypothetical protein PTKIN_Ptkin06aG0001700 [Pterospermum kingtungense]